MLLWTFNACLIVYSGNTLPTGWAIRPERVICSVQIFIYSVNNSMQKLSLGKWFKVSAKWEWKYLNIVDQDLFG